MSYNKVKKVAIYILIIMTVAMTATGVAAIWLPDMGDVVFKAFATMLVVGFGALLAIWAASFIDRNGNDPENLPSFAPRPTATDGLASQSAETTTAK